METSDQTSNGSVLDRQKLLAAVLRQISLHNDQELSSFWTDELKMQSGIKQSFAIGNWLSHRMKIGDDAWRFLAAHSNPIVREWAAVLVGLADHITFARKLAWIKPFADDEQSSLRDIAWMSLRADVVRDPIPSIHCLIPWTGSRNKHLRRFAVEITRPCGICGSHIELLKDHPELGLPILEPLFADECLEVRNSVGNWLIDANTSSPEWVQATTYRQRRSKPSGAGPGCP